MEERINLIGLIKKRLDVKILCSLALGVLLIMGIMIYSSITTQKAELKKGMITHGEGLKSLAYAGIKHPMSVGDSSSVEKQLNDIKKTVKGLDIAICDFDEKIIFATDEKVINKTVNEFITNNDALKSLKELLGTGQTRLKKSFEEKDRDGKRYLVNLYEVLNEEACHHCHGTSKKVIGGMLIKQSAEETYSAISASRNRAIVVGILGIGAVIAMLYFLMTKLIIAQVIKFSKKAEEIAGGDLTVKVEIRGEDEIASLGKSINEIASNLKEMLTKVRSITHSVFSATENIDLSSGKVLNGANVQRDIIDKTAGFIEEIDNSISSVAMAAQNLSASAEETSSSIIQMGTSIERVAESANVFSVSASDSASSIEEMVASIREIAESLELLSASSEETASSLAEINTAVKEVERGVSESVTLAEKVTLEASDKGMNAADTAIKGMEDVRGSVGALSEVINRLGKRSEEIGSILIVIDEVADQTSLLALNAAILAAQAGEQGKGFSVVADEIKTLAERTSASTKEITTLIESVQAETRASVEMAEKGIKSVDKGMKLVKEVNTALKSILDSSHISTEKSRLIQRATTEESYAMKQISEAIKNVSEQIEHISSATKEQSKGSKLIIEATERIKELSQHVKTTTGEQSSGSKQISEAIVNVSHQAEQIAVATSMQRDRSKEIIRSIEDVKKIAAESISIANMMNSAVKSMEEEAKTLISELQKFKV